MISPSIIQSCPSPAAPALRKLFSPPRFLFSPPWQLGKALRLVQPYPWQLGKAPWQLGKAPWQLQPYPWKSFSRSRKLQSVGRKAFPRPGKRFHQSLFIPFDPSPALVPSAKESYRPFGKQDLTSRKGEKFRPEAPPFRLPPHLLFQISTTPPGSTKKGLALLDKLDAAFSAAK